MNNHSMPTEAFNTPLEVTIETVLNRLERVSAKGTDRWMACCPAHDDTSPSLGIRQGHDGTILLYCYAGCTIEEICSALSVTIRDLFPPTRSSPHIPQDTLEDRAYIALCKKHRAARLILSPHEKQRYMIAIERVLGEKNDYHHSQ